MTSSFHGIHPTLAHTALALAMLGAPAWPAFAADAGTSRTQVGATVVSGTIERFDLARAELVLGGQRYTWDVQRPRVMLGGESAEVAALQVGQWVTLQWEAGGGSTRRVRTIAVAAVR